MKKQRNILLMSIISLFLIVLLGILISIPIRTKKETKPKKEFKIQKNIAEPVEFDTLVVEQTQGKPWPIRVQSVEKSYEKDTPKWQVVAENGVMYYTNKKPKVGDIAFYINDNDDITDKDGRVEITRQ
jgi:hypothetical protein